MAVIIKGAHYMPVKGIDDGPRTMKKALVLHTGVTKAKSLYAFWQSGAAGPGVGAHFYVAEDGKLEQYLDTDRQSGHAFDANPWTIALESWDDAKTPVPAWNAAQLATIIALCKELGIPAKLLKEKPSDGVGYHRQFASWNQNLHTCPGDLRAAQVSKVIIPALKEDDVSKKDLKDFFGYSTDEAGKEAGDALVALFQAGTDPGDGSHRPTGKDRGAIFDFLRSLKK